MAQSGYTPILIYASGTASAVPSASNMTSSASGAELALNYADGKLYYKNSSGTVTLLAGAGGAGIVAGSNTQVQYNNNGVFGASANLTFNGTTLTAGGLTTTGTTSTGVLSVTGNTTLGDAAGDTVTINGTITSNLIFTDNTYDIGASGATRPRNLYLAGGITAGGTIETATDLISTGGRLSLYRAGTSYIDWSSGQSLTFRTTTSSGGAGAVDLMSLNSTALYPYNGIVVGTTDATATVTSGGVNTHLTLSSVGAGGQLRLNTTYGQVAYAAADGTFNIVGLGQLYVYKATTSNAIANIRSGAASAVVTIQSDVNTGVSELLLANSATSGRSYILGTAGASYGSPELRSNLYIQDITSGSGNPIRMYMNSSGAFSFNTTYTGPNSSSDINVSTYLSVGTAATQYWQIGKNGTTMRANIMGNSGLADNAFYRYIYDYNATTTNKEVYYETAGLVSLDEGAYSIYTKTTSSWYQAQTMKRGATGFGTTSPEVTSRIHVDARPIYVNNNGAPAMTMNSSGTAYGIVGNTGANAWGLGYTGTLNAWGTQCLIWNNGQQVAFNNLSPDATVSTNSAKYIPITGYDAIKLVNSGSTLVATRGTTYYFAPRSLANNDSFKLLDGTYTYMTFELLISYGGGSAVSGMGSYIVDIINSSIQVVTNGELNSNISVVATGSAYPPSPTAGKLTIACRGDSSNSWIAVVNGTGGTVTNIDIYIRMLNTR